MIYIEQIDLSKDLQQFLIEGFKKNLANTQVWDQTRLLRLKDGLDEQVDKELYNAVKNLALKVQNAVGHNSKFEYFENIEIVKYPKGSSKSFHYDTTLKERVAASITYINDDYVGGQTTIEGVSVQPLTGRTVYFDGKNMLHNVMQVVKGSRYTLSIWYGYREKSPLHKGI